MHTAENDKPKLLIVGLFFNDFKSSAIVKYSIDRELCKKNGLKALNLNNIPLKGPFIVD